METIRYRLTRSAGDGRRPLELQGRRLLVGHADTGIFQIAVRSAARPRKDSVPARRRLREDGDGLAPASVEIFAPLAIVDD
jgi:hypothetical protein